MTRLVSPFGFQSTTSDVLRGVNLSGKIALVTGGNAGIGYETARALAGAGASVVLAARRHAAGLEAAGRIVESTGNPSVSHIPLDLSDLESVAGAVSAWSGPLHILVANALNPGAIATGLQKHTGGLKTPVDRRKSVEQGAATSVFLAASPLVAGIGGRYFEDVNEADVRTESSGMFGTGVADYALEPRYAELLWDVATEMVTRTGVASSRVAWTS